MSRRAMVRRVEVPGRGPMFYLEGEAEVLVRDALADLRAQGFTPGEPSEPFEQEGRIPRRDWLVY